VNTDQLKFGQQGAQFLVDRLHGKGNVIMVTGVAGTFADHERNKGASGVSRHTRGSTSWRSTAATGIPPRLRRATAAQLPSLPQIDGVWVSGGTDGVLKAFVDAGKPMPVTAGEGENGFRRFLLPTGYNGKSAAGISVGQPPFLSLVSLELARQILAKKHAKSNITIPFPIVTDKTVKNGVTAFPKLPDSFFADFTDSVPKATVVICVQAALTGKPCAGRSTSACHKDLSGGLAAFPSSSRPRGRPPTARDWPDSVSQPMTTPSILGPRVAHSTPPTSAVRSAGCAR